MADVATDAMPTDASTNTTTKSKPGFSLKITKWFKYGDGAVRDHGWGCVYRNVQTVRAFNDLPHIDILTIVRRCRPLACSHEKTRPCDKTADAKRKSCLGMDASAVVNLIDLWIEPPDIKRYKLLPVENARAVLFCPDHVKLESFLRRAPRLSKLEDFDEVTCNKERWFELLRTATTVAKQPVVIDDKCMSFLFYGADADSALVVDPHQTNTAKGLSMLPLHTLFNKPWMALFYEPRSTDTAQVPVSPRPCSTRRSGSIRPPS